MFDICSESDFSTIRSLAELYESIPDYCDINHLSEKEFNSTLERLKKTSLQIKNKSNSSIVMMSTNHHLKKKPSKIHHAHRTCDSFASFLSPSSFSHNKKSGRQTTTPNKTIKLSSGKKFSKRNGIKKSCSLNQLYDDMHTLRLSEDLKTTNSINTPKQSTPPINCFFPKSSGRKHKIKPTSINMNSTTSSCEIRDLKSKLNTSAATTDIIQKKKIKNQTFAGTNYCNNLSFLGLTLRKSPEKKSNSPPSPIYPAARLNLAATLRAQVSQKKTSELNKKSNLLIPKRCRSKFDWEVRKTPGWKSLTYCESNKDDLLHRLETRKAEQKLQRQEYDISMELMRQRVKSAPLLLEGVTYWAPKLYNHMSHNCSSVNNINNNPSRLGGAIRCKNKKNTNNTNLIKQMKIINNNNNNNYHFVDNDDLTSEDRAFL